MDICFVGASGHFMYAVNEIKGNESLHIRGFAPGTADENIKPLAEALTGIGRIVPYFADYVDMFNQTEPDLVVISCFFSGHAAVVVEALQRNIHIFVEKPVATTLQDLDMIRKAMLFSDSRLCAMFGLRYAPWFYTAWQSVRHGAVGDIRLMSAQKSYKLGIRGDHYKKRSIYGGTIPWVGSHAIDWLYWFSGRKFTSVTACHSILGNHEHGDLEMTALCQFQLGEHVFGSVQLDYLRPETAPGHADDRLRIAGSEGVIEVRREKVYLINRVEAGEQELQLLRPAGIFADFLADIRSESRCLVNADDSLYITEICLKARMSADMNKTLCLTN